MAGLRSACCVCFATVPPFCHTTVCSGAIKRGICSDLVNVENWSGIKFAVKREEQEVQEHSSSCDGVHERKRQQHRLNGSGKQQGAAVQRTGQCHI